MKLFALSFALLLPGLAAAQIYTEPYEKDNGVIRIRLNDRIAPHGTPSPMITGLWIGGRQAVPHDNAGADFQMTSRSRKGNRYNPTQGGDCAGRTSLLNAVIPNWDGAQLGTPASHGLLFGIDPLLYDEPGLSGTCESRPNAQVAPYDMAFGATLGDGVALPREAMVLDMSIRKDHPEAENLVKDLSELPVAFVDADFLRYAYYSTDGRQFQRMYGPPGGVVSHDIKQWIWNENVVLQGHAIALCDRPDMIENPSQGTCMAFYSHETTAVYASRRMGARELALMSIRGDNPGSEEIADTRWYTARRLVAVGHLTSVAAVIEHAERNFPAGSWARW